MRIHAHGTGTTVLELMVTLAIAAILVTLSVPSFQQYLHRQQVKAAVEQLHHDLMLARAEAVYRNAVVIACPGAPETGCAIGPDWSDGWIVFADSNGDRALSPGESVIRYGQLVQDVAVLTTAGRGPLRFSPDGSAPGTNMTISLCGRGGPDDARKLVISNIGRIRRDTWPDLDAARCPA